MTTAVERVQSLGPIPRAARICDGMSAVVLRYGLVLFLVGGGLGKFTQQEAVMIQPWVAHSPLLGWLYTITAVQGASILIGAIEVIVGILLRSVTGGRESRSGAVWPQAFSSSSPTAFYSRPRPCRRKRKAS